MNVCLGIFLLVLLGGSSAVFAESDLVTNGSFESPDVPTGSYQIFSNIPGWVTTVGNGIEIQDHVAGDPSEDSGNQFVELDSSGNSGMKQTLGTETGKKYLLSFIYSPRPHISENSNLFPLASNQALLPSIANSLLERIGLFSDEFSKVFSISIFVTY